MRAMSTDSNSTHLSGQKTLQSTLRLTTGENRHIGKDRRSLRVMQGSCQFGELQECRFQDHVYLAAIPLQWHQVPEPSAEQNAPANPAISPTTTRLPECHLARTSIWACLLQQSTPSLARCSLQGRRLNSDANRSEPLGGGFT